MHFAVDSGGTSTRLMIETSTPMRLPSLNPASVTDPRASWNLLLGEVADAAQGREVQGWIGSASVNPVSVAAEVAHLQHAASNHSVRGAVWLANDMLPWLLAPPLSGVGIVGGIGTGTSFVGRDSAGRSARASGLEFVLDDAGGAADAGLQGLRAAARAYDGRGPNTVLHREAVVWGNAEMPELGSYLATEARVKPIVATFAPLVCQAASVGDQVALSVIEEMVDAILSGILAVAEKLDVLAPQLVLVGGFIEQCEPLRTSLSARLSAELGVTASVHRDSLPAAMGLALESRRWSDGGEIAGLPWRKVVLH